MQQRRDTSGSERYILPETCFRMDESIGRFPDRSLSDLRHGQGRAVKEFRHAEKSKHLGRRGDAVCRFLHVLF